MTAQSAGLDSLCRCRRSATILQPGDIKLIPCVVRDGDLPMGYERRFWPRSGLASKFGVTLINSPGTIDADYRGEVHVPLINHGKQLFTVERGTRTRRC